MNEALFGQEVILEESALFHLKFDSGIHVACHDIENVRKLSLLKVLDILCALRDVTQHQTAQGISAAAK